MDNNKGVKTMMRKSLLATGIMTLVGFYTGAASAGSVAIPNTFVAGTKAVAADVNANFTAVKSAVDDNDTRVTANANSITTNANNITTNTNNITTNANNITTNTNNITTNANDIATLQQSVGCAGNDANDVMVSVGSLCVDKYEASVWNTAGGGGTQYGVGADDYPCANNANNCTGGTTIYARSEAGKTPSTNITWFQAQQACAASGKRLLGNAEWQMAVAGTVDPGAGGDGVNGCNTNSGGRLPTGNAGANCLSNWGTADMIGNVWEWVGDWILGQDYNASGQSNNTGAGAGGSYGTDAVSNTTPAVNQGAGASNMLAALQRGGRHTGNGGLAAGAFALTASSGPGNSDIDVGFRCAR